MKCLHASIFKLSSLHLWSKMCMCVVSVQPPFFFSTLQENTVIKYCNNIQLYLNNLSTIMNKFLYLFAAFTAVATVPRSAVLDLTPLLNILLFC